MGLAFWFLRCSLDASWYSLVRVFGGGGARRSARATLEDGRGYTLRSDGDDDTESSEDGQGGTDDDLHGVVRGVVGCPGTVWAESDEVG
jgi:hypothetical protein